MSDLLTVNQLSVHYGGIQAVRDVSFSVKEGEQTTLIGANGAGKSSTVRAITGLEPFRGEILFNGKPIRKRRAESLLREGLVMVPEGRGIFALNRALLSQPRLLILDEPSMGLAPLMVENIFRVIATLRQRGVALLLIEQNARLALEATDSAWVMDSGSIVERGPSQTLLADDRIAQIYLGEMPV